jgi:hypothetical protein
MNRSYYFNANDAREFKSNFNSWIGRKAHVGNGKTLTLQTIDIREKKQYKTNKDPEKLYRVEFCFENNKRLSTYELLFYNGLHNSTQLNLGNRQRGNSAA